MERIKRDRPKLWAEAVKCLNKGEPSYLVDKELAAEGDRIAAEHSQGANDPWVRLVEDYINKQPKKDLEIGRYVPTEDWDERVEPLDRILVRGGIADILTMAIGMPAERHNNMVKGRVVSILSHLGWKKKDVREIGGNKYTNKKAHYVSPEYGTFSKTTTPSFKNSPPSEFDENGSSDDEPNF